MDKATARAKVLELWKQLHEHCAAKIVEIEELCDQHNIVHYFTGLPPFDEYGNSGYYLPINPENGEGWESSEQIKDQYGYNAEAGAWVSSSDRCS